MQASRPPENAEQVCFTATSQGLDELHGALERFWRLCDAAPHGPPPGVWRHMFATAVGEIAGNIVQHAYAGRPGSVINLRLRLSHDHVVARFVDRGGTYMPPPKAALVSTHACDLAEDACALAEGGRGLPIAAAVLDVLQYRRTASGTNMWRLVKRMRRS